MALPARPVCITLLLTNEFTEEVDLVITLGNIVTINGYGLKVIVPPGLTIGEVYTITIRTQTSVKNGANLLKEACEVVSDTPLVAQSE